MKDEQCGVSWDRQDGASWDNHSFSGGMFSLVKFNKLPNIHVPIKRFPTSSLKCVKAFKLFSFYKITP